MSLVPKSDLCAALLLLASATAHAGFDCTGSHGGFRPQTDDSWVGTDKLEHFGVSAPFGALDGTCRTDGFSYKDLFADAPGAFTGAWLAHWAITYSGAAHGKTIGVRYDDAF